MISFEFPSKVPLAQIPTPMHRLERISEELNADIWIKRDDLTGSVMTGNKVRKLEYTIGRAIEEGADTLITCGGLQSNHCRATAAAGAQLGLDVNLLLRGPLEAMADGNLLLDGLFGAEVDIINGKANHARLPELMEAKARELRAKGKSPFTIPIGASDGIGIWGYISAASEMAADFSVHGFTPDFIVCASGSGGTQAGLTVGCEAQNIGSQVLGFAVCDDEDYFQSKIREDLGLWQSLYDIDGDLDQLSIQVNDSYIGPGYAKAGPEIFECIQWLARLEGVVLDPVYTGKAFYGLVSEIRNGALGQNPKILFVHTGGLFGIYPYRDKFSIKVNNS